MGYESKIIIGEKVERDSELYGFMPFAEFDCGKCGFIKNERDFYEVFSNEIFYHKDGAYSDGLYINGEPRKTDYYGDKLKYCEISKLIEVLEKSQGEHRKLDAILGFLKAIDQSKFYSLIAIHFGY